MRVLLAVLVSFGSLAAIAAPPPTSERPVIALSQLSDMFANMRANPKWNVDGPLLWGYFFTDPKPKKLEPVAQELGAAGYRIVDIYPTDDKATYVLHVEKVEHHTPESLNKRNQEFEQLAEKYHLESYDGMDVGLAN